MLYSIFGLIYLHFSPLQVTMADCVQRMLLFNLREVIMIRAYYENKSLVNTESYAITDVAFPP